MITLQSNGQVRMRTDIHFPVSMEQAWQTVSQVESFACIDFFHRKIRTLERPGEPPGRILIDHRFLGVQITRKGKIYGWREGSGYRFTDLSRRDRRCGFPHVYMFTLRREGVDRCSLRIEINGRWTTGWMPRLLVILWLQLIFTKITTSAEQVILVDACKAIAHSGLPMSLANRAAPSIFGDVGIPVFLILLTPTLSGAASPLPDPSPNIVIIFSDDQGYADVGVYGATGFQTPNLDRMAREGVRFTDFYVAQPACSASRAALLTGTYPNRFGIHGALGPTVKIGIHSREVTIAEMLKEVGYTTAIFGKWHLGRPEVFLPTRHGFDEYFGLPYSNDMWPFRPGAPDHIPDLPLIKGEKVIALNPDQSKLTRQYTERAVRFIHRNRQRPFFLYVPHNMPHVPLSVSGKFKGHSQQGLYGDVISEIDWLVGKILAAIRKNGLDRRTLVIFASDNGPWLGYGDHAGSAGPLREGKGTTWEGGVRVPAIMRWPGQIPANSLSREPAMTIDLLPTIAGITGAELPAHGINGLDIWPLINGTEGARSPHQAYFFYNRRNELQALRSGHWKLHVPHMYWTLGGREPGSGGTPARYDYVETELGLYDLHSDIGETNNVAGEHPEVVKRLLALAERARRDMGDSLTDRQGENVRDPGRVQE